MGADFFGGLGPTQSGKFRALRLTFSHDSCHFTADRDVAAACLGCAVAARHTVKNKGKIISSIGNLGL